MKASKQALLDAKAQVKAEWVIVKELGNRRIKMQEMAIEIAQLRRERDEARHLVCQVGCSISMAKENAARRGWDCYKETL
jgi:hypothetical protein